MTNKEALQDKLAKINFKKQNQGLKYSRQVNDVYTFMDSTIRKQFKSFNLLSICGGQRRNYMVDKYLQAGFTSLSLIQKIFYYEHAVISVIERAKLTSIVNIDIEEMNFSIAEDQDIPIKIIKGFKEGDNYKIKTKENAIATANITIMRLNPYIIRKSKKDNQHSYCFQAIAKNQPQTIRFQFLHNYAQNFQIVQKCILKGFCEKIWELAKIQTSILKNGSHHHEKQIKLSKKPNVKILQPVEAESLTELNEKVELRKNISFRNDNLNDKSLVEQLIREKDNQQMLQQNILEYIDRKNEETEHILQQAQQNEVMSKPFTKKYHNNIIRVILPNYNLAEIESFQQFSPISKNHDKHVYIYQHALKKSIFKVELTIFEFTPQKVVQFLANVPDYKHWNGQVSQSQMKMHISSENSSIMYQKHKAFSEWYRERDFLYLKHLFKMEECFYLVDKSIQNVSFIPFQSINRGEIHYAITKISSISYNNQKPNEFGSRVIIEIDLDHKGLLNERNHTELTLRYLKQYENLSAYIKRFTMKNQKSLNKTYFNLEWEIDPLYSQNFIKNQSHQHRMRHSSSSFDTCNFENNHIEELDDPDQFFSIEDDSEKRVEPNINKTVESNIKKYTEANDKEITKEELLALQRKTTYQLEEIKQFNEEKICLNEEGLCILPQKYLKVRHIMAPVSVPEKRKICPYETLLMKDQFIIQKNGGLKLVNKASIDAQNNVISFVMSTLKKNILSGKGILNISLPVEIFSVDSNVQRMCESMALAPDFLEKKACIQKSPLQRFKYCVAFALSNSILFFDIYKPFNPILGETYQGIIDGCPVYAEQISHHPPITSIYMVGRGYKIHANLEAKVNIHLNSADGINDGFYCIEFTNGDKVLFHTPPGEVSGLTIGDRQYHIRKHIFVVDPKNMIYCAINFQDSSGIFSKTKWKFNDQMDGDIVRVSESFMAKFLTTTDEKLKPSKKQIQQECGKISGRWVEQLLIDNILMYDIMKDIPHQLLHYEYPLNSNSNYREDLIYRKKNDLARSQIEKERLEIVQRNDRKLREKFHPKKH